MTQTPCGCSSSYQTASGYGSASSTNNAAFWTLITLAILVGLLFIGGIIWCACEYNKKKSIEIDINARRRNNRRTCGTAFGDSASAADDIPMGNDTVFNDENHIAALDENGNVIIKDVPPEYAESNNNNNNMVQNAIDNTVEGAQDAWNSTKNFFQTPFASDDSYYGESQAKCFDGSSDWRNDGGSYAHNLNVNHLMPASWRNSQPCTSLNDTDTTQWAAYSPSKQAFDSYITSAGSARLSVNTRSALSRQTGVKNMLLDMRSPAPVPLGSNAVIFNDSDLRQSLVYDATGLYPQLTFC